MRFPACSMMYLAAVAFEMWDEAMWVKITVSGHCLCGTELPSWFVIGQLDEGCRLPA